MKHNHPKIEIMDTTLRDGEQTSGVSFVPHEKLMIARLLLEELKVDRVEVASARVSEGEFDAVKMICDWAARRNLLPRVEVLGFVDGHTSVDWIHATGCRVINLLCKGSLKHCTYQLKKTPEEHIEDILSVVDYANEQDMVVNVYLEDWSNGMKDSPEYVFRLMDALEQTNIRRYMLPDTLGVLNPLQVIEFMRKMVKRYPHAHFDFHAHNDYDLAVSNVLAAVLSGCKGLHTTINGLGERAGNAPLASVQAILKDHFNAITNIDESRLNDVAVWWSPTRASSFPPINRLLARMYLPKWQASMPTVTIKVTSTATTSCPNALVASESMPWARTAVKPISGRIWRTWGYNWMKMPCAK